MKRQAANNFLNCISACAINIKNCSPRGGLQIRELLSMNLNMTIFKNTKTFSSFSVDDLEKAKEFYGKTLGIDVSESDEGLILYPKSSNELFIYPKTDHSPASFTVLNFPVNDVEQTVNKLKSMGIQFEIYDEGELKTDENGIFKGENGFKIAWFKDPAGNFLSVLKMK
jgi:predicted enzyme related to lactoylglutathione lyase